MTCNLEDINRLFINTFGSPSMNLTKYLFRWTMPNGLEFSVEQRGKRFVNLWIACNEAVIPPVELNAEIRRPDCSRIHNLTHKARPGFPVMRVKIVSSDDLKNATAFLASNSDPAKQPAETN